MGEVIDVRFGPGSLDPRVPEREQIAWGAGYAIGILGRIGRLLSDDERQQLQGILRQSTQELGLQIPAHFRDAFDEAMR